MIKEKLDNLFIEITNNCKKIIQEKNININELAFRMGMSTNNLEEIFKARNKDFLIYLDVYDTLVEW